ncbi:arginine N-succinyltransferase [uncultured Umboniibacter sp.]|uniref:arginine N-succinyltransferase n=1 Tax=uncultured Umboniibacter sp. TaxID=1798917 RepID=UPI00260DBDAC|nr:arginine N-succinyltransferase [uncultured Umboniibacter sp.]
MLVIRPVELGDVEDLHALALKAGKGLTSLPPDHETLAAKVQRSTESFARSKNHVDDYFLLVMVDTAASRVVGTAAVYGTTGTRQAFYAYRLMSVTHHSHSLDKQIRAEMLHLSNDYTDCAEVGTLFLDPAYRGNGHWLSRSRYLLMGQHPHRFQPYVIAEMRGWLNEEGVSPFWEAIGRQFFDMSFEEADRLCGIGSNQFITELMPKHPIYTCMLPDSAQQVLGKPHVDTVRAVELLEAEGFEYDKMIDIFDGGPILRAKVANLFSVKATAHKAATIDDELGTSPKPIYMLANSSLKSFRVVCEPAVMAGQTAAITSATAAQLNIASGDEIHLLDTGKTS